MSSEGKKERGGHGQSPVGKLCGDVPSPNIHYQYSGERAEWERAGRDMEGELELVRLVRARELLSIGQQGLCAVTWGLQSEFQSELVSDSVGLRCR
jgi:hypothetical protein